MGHAYVITSGKGGVGKTVTTFNIGAGLALEGKRVIMIDGDVGLPDLDRIMGLQGDARRMAARLEGKKHAPEYLLDNGFIIHQMVAREWQSNIVGLIPAQVIKSMGFGAAMIRLVTLLKERYDYVLIDCPSGLEKSFDNAVGAADNAVIVVDPQVTSVRDGDRVIGILDKYGITDNMIIINRVNKGLVRSGSVLGTADIMDILAVELLGIVPEEHGISPSITRGMPVLVGEKSRAGRAYGNITRRILGEMTEHPCIFDEKTLDRSIFSRLSGMLAGFLTIP